MVETFAAQGADEAFDDRVRSGCLDRVRMMQMSAVVKTASTPVVNLLSRLRIKNLNWSARSPRSINRLRACWITRASRRERRRWGVSRTGGRPTIPDRVNLTHWVLAVVRGGSDPGFIEHAAGLVVAADGVQAVGECAGGCLGIGSSGPSRWR